MQAFAHTSLPGRVVFGGGTIDQLAGEAERLGVKRALVLSTPGQKALAETAAQRLGAAAAGTFAGAVMHTPVEVTGQAMAEVARCRADGLVAIGGGSTIGLSKALALRTDLPQLVVPTTYAGSEMTTILGQTENGAKVTLRDARVLPETVIYDVSLTLRLPPKYSAVSGMNAIAHAVEALYARDRNPLTDLMAEKGIALLVGSLPAIVENPGDAQARSDALSGAWLCGLCLASVSMALHHKLCHTLGGMFDLPHAEAHAVVLPYAMRFNAAAAPETAAAVARILGDADPARGLQQFARRIGAPRSLGEIGMPANAIEATVTQVLASPYWNPRPLEAEALRELLRRAARGDEA